MSKFISSDSVIGNFVIETLEKDDFNINLEKLYNFDDLLSSRLAEHNYYTRFDLSHVIDFQESYPFLVQSIDNDCLHIVSNIENMEEFRSLLVRYFRLGMPKVVVNEMKFISKIVLE